MSGPPFVKGGYVQVDECINDIDLRMSYDAEIRAAMNRYVAEDGDYLGFTKSETGLQIGVKRCSREELAKTHIMHRWLEELNGPVRAPEVYGYKEEEDKVLMFLEYIEAKRDINLKDVITDVIKTMKTLQETGFYHGDLKLRRDSSNILVADKISDKIYLIDFETTKFQSVNDFYDCFHLFVSVEGELDGLYEALRRGATELVLGLASKHPDNYILDNLPTAFQKLNRMRVSTSCELFLPTRILKELDTTQDWDTLWQRQKCEGNILSIKRMESGLDKIDIEDNAQELKPRFLKRITLSMTIVERNGEGQLTFDRLLLCRGWYEDRRMDEG